MYRNAKKTHNNTKHMSRTCIENAKKMPRKCQGNTKETVRNIWKCNDKQHKHSAPAKHEEAEEAPAKHEFRTNVSSNSLGALTRAHVQGDPTDNHRKTQEHHRGNIGKRSVVFGLFLW